MNRYPKNKHYNPRPGGASSSSSFSPDIELGLYPNKFRLKDTASKISREIRPANFPASVALPGILTQALTQSGITDYPNLTVLDIEVTIIGVRSDGLASFSAKRSATFRLVAGNWTMDNQRAGSNLESIATTFGAAPITLLVNSNTPSATLDLSGAAAAGTYHITAWSEITVKSV